MSKMISQDQYYNGGKTKVLTFRLMLCLLFLRMLKPVIYKNSQDPAQSFPPITLSDVVKEGYGWVNFEDTLRFKFLLYQALGSVA